MLALAAGAERLPDAPSPTHSAAHSELPHDDLQANVLPFFLPTELHAVAATGVAWRSIVACFAASSAAARGWLCGPYCAELEAGAVEMCRLASNSSWFATTGYSLALLAATSPGEDLLQRALDKFDRMPPWVARPDRDLRAHPVAIEKGSDVSLSGVSGKEFTAEVERRMSRALSQHWGSAYISTDGEFDCATQEQVAELMRRLRALWALAKCCRGTRHAVVMEEVLVMFKNPSLRANERWTLYTLAMCSSTEPASSHKLALALLSYHEGRLMG
uniref:Uncharacterized protein n=1 Tax=Alexandrium monilatum TaxID=311494 RepID=A0A7S4R918_9DINO